MELEKRLREYKAQANLIPQEEELSETIEKSKEVFVRQEEMQPLSYQEFLLWQLRLIRKRWWLIQALLLAITALVLSGVEQKIYVTRTLGVAAVLFVVLIIPEFWKNKSNDCMQVEAACLYSLRQIYAARMLLFGIVDTFLIGSFCVLLRGNVQLSFEELLVQFLFPMVVTAGICFGSLCSKSTVSETGAVLACLFWSGVWWQLLLQRPFYARIPFPVWCGLFALALVFFAAAAYKTIHDCNNYWEVDVNGITNG